MLTINQTEKRQLDWVEGALPRDWALKRGRTLYTRVREEPKPEDSIVTAFRDGQVTLRENRRTDGFTNAVKEHGYQRVRKGDLVIHSMDGFAGAIGVSDSHGKCSPVYVVCEPHKASCPRYHAYVLRHMAIFGYITSLAKGIRERSTAFGWSEFRDEYLPAPPLPTQKAIANFLDRKTAAIDALIEKKEKLLELLAEKRSALINQAVTKGLDPNVPMKDSGIPWIGEIPEHWESKPSKYVLDFVTSGSRGWSEYFSDFGSIFLQSGNLVGNLKVDFDNVQRVEPPQNAEGARTRVRVGDVLVCITGGLTGNVGIVEGVPEVTFVNQHLGLLRPVKNEIDSKFLALQLASLVGQHHFQMVQYGGTKQGLSLTDLKNAGLAVPPITEQFSIVEAVENQLARISMARDKSESQISLLREYRQSLITAAVTGQLEIPTKDYE